MASIHNARGDLQIDQPANSRVECSTISVRAAVRDRVSHTGERCLILRAIHFDFAAVVSHVLCCDGVARYLNALIGWW